MFNKVNIMNHCNADVFNSTSLFEQDINTVENIQHTDIKNSKNNSNGEGMKCVVNGDDLKELLSLERNLLDVIDNSEGMDRRKKKLLTNLVTNAFKLFKTNTIDTANDGNNNIHNNLALIELKNIELYELVQNLINKLISFIMAINTNDPSTITTSATTDHTSAVNSTVTGTTNCSMNTIIDIHSINNKNLEIDNGYGLNHNEKLSNTQTNDNDDNEFEDSDYESDDIRNHNNNVYDDGDNYMNGLNGYKMYSGISDTSGPTSTIRTPQRPQQLNGYSSSPLIQPLFLSRTRRDQQQKQQRQQFQQVQNGKYPFHHQQQQQQQQQQQHQRRKYWNNTMNTDHGW